MSGAASTRLVAIVGGSASGKTWLADRLAALLGDRAARLTQDDFYRDWSHLPAAQRTQVNFDHPDALDWFDLEATLKDLRAGRPAARPSYDFNTHCRRPADGTIPAAPVVIVDGLWLLHRPDLRPLFDLAVFLHCAEDERLRRRLVRDVAERGRTAQSVTHQFQTAVAPMHRRYVEPQARWADVVLTHPYAPAEVAALEAALDALLGPGAVAPATFRSDFESLFPAPSLP